MIRTWTTSHAAMICDKCGQEGPEALNVEAAARLASGVPKWKIDGESAICHKCQVLMANVTPPGAAR